MQTSSFLTALFFSALVLFGFQILSPPSTAFSLTATVDIKPDTLNVNMKGKWITAYIELTEGNVSDIDTSKPILLADSFQAEWWNIEGKVLMVKFDASSVTDYALLQLNHMGLGRTSIELKVTGQLKDGTQFEGRDTITIMNPPFGH